MLTEAILAALIQTCAPDVGYSTMRAIIQVESGGRPWTINSNTAKRTFSFNSQEEAQLAAERMVRAGHNIDMGLAQINSSNLRWLGLTPRQVFEPCTNIRSSAALLKSKFAAAWQTHYQKGAAVVLRHAISRYNTGNDWRGFRNGYVAKVEAAASGKRSPTYAVRTPAPVVAQSAVVWSRRQTTATQLPGTGLQTLGGTFKLE